MLKLTDSPRAAWTVRALVALVVAALIAVVVPQTPMKSAGAATPATPSEMGALWLAAKITDEGWVPNSMGDPSVGGTVSVVLSLAAAGVGGDDFVRAVAWIEDHVDEYAMSGGVDVAGSLGYLLLVADAAGIDPTDFGGHNLVARAQATLGALEPGLYGAASPTYDGVFRQSLVIMGLSAAGVTPAPEAVDWLKDQQCTSPLESIGGWEAYRADSSLACAAPDPTMFTGPDTNSTALAVMALVEIGADPDSSPALLDARDFLGDAQGADGGFGYLTDLDADPNSTALVIMAIVALGESPHDAAWVVGDSDPMTSLLSWQLGCDAEEADRGAFSSPYSNGGPDSLASTQAVWGASEQTFPLGEVAFGTDPEICAAEVPDGPGTTVAPTTTDPDPLPTTSTTRPYVSPARIVAAQPTFTG